MMKKIKKVISIILASITMCATGFTMGCGGTADGNQDLEIYALVQGYGMEPIQTLVNEFQKQDWVKEKYPDLSIKLETDDITGQSNKKLAAGAKYNTTDILVGGWQLETQWDGAKKGAIENITESVYNQEVPGEPGVKFADKMLPAYLQAAAHAPESWVTPNYYRVPMVAGVTGIIYNETILNKLGLDVPLTTDELVEQCAYISNNNTSDYSEGYAIMTNAKDGYWHEMFSTWWAQYSGNQKYTDFYYGLYGDVQSSDVYKDQGRLEALKVFEEIFSPRKEVSDFKYNETKPTYKYVYPFANEASTDYMVVQSAFLGGKGVFHANGDWFETEMHIYREDYEKKGYDYTFKFMRYPIISSIIDTLPDKSVADDNELRALVKAIDAGNKALESEGYSVTEKDYNRVKEARCLVPVRNGGGARIPTYASAKEVAIDFLRFIATDIAQEALIKNAFGLCRPFKYDFESNPEIKEFICDTHTTKLEIFNSKELPMVGLFSKDLSPYGITQFNHYKVTDNTTSLETIFTTNSNTAQGVFDIEANFWNDAQALWKQMLGDVTE